MDFQSVDFERTWYRLFWANLMQVILSEPDTGYFERTWYRLFWANLIQVILSEPDAGYFERTWYMLFWANLIQVILSEPDTGYFERTWYRLFVSTKFDIYVFMITVYNWFTLIRHYFAMKHIHTAQLLMGAGVYNVFTTILP